MFKCIICALAVNVTYWQSVIDLAFKSNTGISTGTQHQLNMSLSLFHTFLFVAYFTYKSVKT